MDDSDDPLITIIIIIVTQKKENIKIPANGSVGIINGSITFFVSPSWLECIHVNWPIRTAY